MVPLDMSGGMLAGVLGEGGSRYPEPVVVRRSTRCRLLLCDRLYFRRHLETHSLCFVQTPFNQASIQTRMLSSSPEYDVQPTVESHNTNTTNNRRQRMSNQSKSCKRAKSSPFQALEDVERGGVESQATKVVVGDAAFAFGLCSQGLRREILVLRGKAWRGGLDRVWRNVIIWGGSASEGNMRVKIELTLIKSSRKLQVGRFDFDGYWEFGVW